MAERTCGARGRWTEKCLRGCVRCGRCRTASPRTASPSSPPQHLFLWYAWIGRVTSWAPSPVGVWPRDPASAPARADGGRRSRPSSRGVERSFAPPRRHLVAVCISCVRSSPVGALMSQQQPCITHCCTRRRRPDPARRTTTLHPSSSSKPPPKRELRPTAGALIRRGSITPLRVPAPLQTSLAT